LLEYVGPLVDTAPQEKPLSIALREINADLVEFRPAKEVEPATSLRLPSTTSAPSPEPA
jgi:DNA-directed RNA polymerase subunit omega